jgi:DNA processing protein
LIVSGLAYGIDVFAHKYSIENNVKTVAVLAHGLDRIYPTSHNNIATQMLQNGGLITEFLSKTNLGRENFVRRNRIVAGISEATIVVESKIKGGAMITAKTC